MSDHDTDRAVDHALEAWTPLEPPADFADRVLSAHTLAPPMRRRRAWMFAAPVAAAAVAAVVLLVFSRTAKDAAAPQAQEMSAVDHVAADHLAAGSDVVAVNAGSSAGSGAGVAPFVADASVAPVVADDAAVAPVIADADVTVQQPDERPPITKDPTSQGDLVIAAGASITVHEPAGSVRVRIDFGTRCPNGGVVVSTADDRVSINEGRTFAVVNLEKGVWTYGLRCKIAPPSFVAEGRIMVLADDAHRRLPSAPASNVVDTDGRTWRVSYQIAVPTIQVRAPGGGVLHVASAGQELTFAVVAGVVKVPGDKLAEGTYTLWTEANGVKQPRATTLIIDFDASAPQIYLAGITSGPGGSPIIRGRTLPGWRISIDGVELPLGKNLQFEARVRFSRAVIRAEHPTRGVHYYLTRLLTK